MRENRSSQRWEAAEIASQAADAAAQLRASATTMTSTTVPALNSLIGPNRTIVAPYSLNSGR